MFMNEYKILILYLFSSFFKTRKDENRMEWNDTTISDKS